MRYIILIFVVNLTFSWPSIVHGQNSLDGIYIGLEEMCSLDSLGNKECFKDSSRLEWDWFHLTTIKIKGDSVFIDMEPILIFERDTIASAADGCYYYYSGIVTHKRRRSLTIELIQIGCHYCLKPLIRQADGSYINDTSVIRKTYRFRLKRKCIRSQKVNYQKSSIDKVLCSEDPECVEL